jgi:DNA-binding response OmpR family regulator
MSDANIAQAGAPQGQLPSGLIDFASAQITYSDGQNCPLSGTEANLLRYFWDNRGHILSRTQILSSVWGITSSKVRTRTIDMHVAHLRRKLREERGARKLLVSVRGKGYLFSGETCAAGV